MMTASRQRNRDVDIGQPLAGAGYSGHFVGAAPSPRLPALLWERRLYTREGARRDCPHRKPAIGPRAGERGGYLLSGFSAQLLSTCRLYKCGLPLAGTTTTYPLRVRPQQRSAIVLPPVGAAPSPRSAVRSDSTAESARGRASHPTPVGAAPSPRSAVRGESTAVSARGRGSHPTPVGAAPSPRLPAPCGSPQSARGRALLQQPAPSTLYPTLIPCAA